jgi:putative transposase
MVLSDFLALKPEDRAPVAISIDLRYRQPQSSLTDGQKKRYECVHKRLGAISEPAVLEEMLVFGRFSSKLESVAGAHHVHRTTLGRELSRLFDCGSDLHVATMSIVLGGGSRKSTERVVVHKLGRKPNLVVTGHDPEAIGVNTSEDAKKSIGLLLQGTKDRDKLTVAELYRRFKDRYAKRASGAMADGTVIFEPIPEMSITEGAFRYHVARLETKAAIAKAKLGSSKFAKDLRTLLSHSKELINYPGHTYIIDSTVGDVYLVCAVDRRLLIGRPVIYVVMDAFSSLILSVHVSLEGPSLEQAEIALYRAMTPKDKLLDFLGKGSLLDALPQGCRPTFVFSDRGELLSNGARHMAERTGIAQSLAAAYRADWKGMLERYFGIQNELVIHWLPGAVRQRMRERGDRDVRLDAILTVNELLRILLSLAAEWNLTHDMTRHVSGAMLRKGIEATPISFNEYGLEALHGAPKFLERSDAIRQLLTPLDFNATRKGLELGNLRFTSPWMRDDDTFYDMRGSKASVFLNPDQPRSAFVLEPESKELHEVSLVDMRGYAEEDVSIGDIQMVEDYLPLKRGDEQKAQENIEPTLRGQRAAIIAEARGKTAAAKAGDTRSKTQQTNGQKQNRAAAIASQVAGSSPVLPAAPKAASPEDAIWLQAMTEKFSTEGAK